MSVVQLGRIGDNMITAIRLTAESGPYASVTHLGREIAKDGHLSNGTDAVSRCIERGLLVQDPEHKDTGLRSAGAVVLTDEGESFYSMFNFTDKSVSNR